MRIVVMWLLAGVVVGGCAGVGGALKETKTLDAPPGTTQAAVVSMQEGNRLYAARQWEAAMAKYQEAIKVQPSLAEAHYNLAMVLDILEQPADAKKHYVEAANLAPGHQVIWNAPPFRKHGLVDSGPKSGPFITPALTGAH
jgi:tetratricopeptide (TPR) repeat protein